MVRSHPQYTEYEVSIDSKMVCIWFTKSSVSSTELNLKLKPHANDIKISPNFISMAISFPIDRIWSWNWFWGDLFIVNKEFCFYDKIEPQIKTSWKRYQNKPKFYICCDLIPDRQNMKLQLLLRWFAYSSLRVVFLR